MHMSYDNAKRFWQCMLLMLSTGNGQSMVQDPAHEMRDRILEGAFDDMEPEEQDRLAEDAIATALFFGSKESSVSDVFQKAVQYTDLAQRDIDRITDILASASSVTHYPDASAPYQDEGMGAEGGKWRPMRVSPKEVYWYLDREVYGQEEAKRAAAMLVHHHLMGRSRHLVMAGPTGCGKTEIWRVLSRAVLGDMACIINGPQLALDGWNGSMHLSDVFLNAPKGIAGHMVLVIDEADKMLEPKVAKGGTDFARQIQNELLKIMDGDTVTYYGKDRKESVTVDCSNISVVLCGSFESMLAARAESSRRIGIVGQDAGIDTDVQVEDLVRHANMRREVAGRVSRIVRLDALGEADFLAILKGRMSPVGALRSDCGLEELTLDEASMKRLAHDAAESGMGCRFLRSKLQSLLDEKMFEDCRKPRYRLRYMPEGRGGGSKAEENHMSP